MSLYDQAFTVLRDEAKGGLSKGIEFILEARGLNGITSDATAQPKDTSKTKPPEAVQSEQVDEKLIEKEKGNVGKIVLVGAAIAGAYFFL